MKRAKAATERDAAVTLRFVGRREGQTLNARYRGKRHATNVLAFAYDRNARIEGDIVLCAPVVEREARAQDTTVRVVMITGAGGAFCAGHDLKEMRAEPSQGYYEALFAQCARVMLTIQRLPVPVIARVQGIATAAGCQLVAACDLAVAADSARFAVSGVNLGLFCSSPSVAAPTYTSREGPHRQNASRQPNHACGWRGGRSSDTGVSGMPA